MWAFHFYDWIGPAAKNKNHIFDDLDIICKKMYVIMIYLIFVVIFLRIFPFIKINF